MIITRTSFRISFAGGGSDLPSYYSRRAGAVTELVDAVDEIEHPLVRECLKHVELRRGLEIVSMADLPSQSGISSSGSFTVGLLHALYAMQGKVATPERLALDACAMSPGGIPPDRRERRRRVGSA
jgi:D-glycero-alpha-D-manno-heptose-7-phosphate kinase